LHKEEIVMRKQFWAALALVLLTLPPARAQSPVNPTTVRREFLILEAMPCAPSRPDTPMFTPFPTGITRTETALVGSGGGVAQGTTPACRFIGSILALDPGADGRFTSFAGGGLAGSDPVVQGIKLIKVVPRVPKCPDLWPGQTFIQTGLTGIRTFFPLKYTPCDTTFTLEVEFASVDKTVPRNAGQVNLNQFVFKVVVRPQTLEWVVDALHCAPLGVCEVPCITDEDLFQVLLTQSRAIATAAAGTNLQTFNAAVDAMEATVVRNCFFQLRAFSFDDKGALSPCSIFQNQLPGNKTIANAQFGFGIVETVENPCCCKLIADLACLKRDVVGAPAP
jgi:hypothetical protein